MVRKKRVEDLIKPLEKPEDSGTILIEEPIVETKEPKLTDIIKVKVLVGTLQWEGGTFEKGSIFECSRQRALLFESKDIEILEA